MESLLITLPAVLLAELGDKTQLLILYLAARYRSPRAILAGLVCGAAINAGIAVAGGTLLGRFLPEGLLTNVVAIGFLLIAAWILFGPEEDDESIEQQTGFGSAFLATLWLFVVMEMGDKTQLATVALSAGLPQPGWVYLGAVMGLVLANLPALWVGHRFAARLPRRLVRWISGGLFAVIGIGLLLGQVFGQFS
ncbi:MAG: TMEM165/GDT1 family protein [Wenzhouxiangellaceae bacterium]